MLLIMRIAGDTMTRTSGQTGLTLIEMMIVVAIIGIFAMIAIPSMRESLERQRIRGAAELIRDQLMVARNEAVKRSTNITVSFVGGSNWAFGMSTSACAPTGAGCTLPYPDPGGGAPTTVSTVFSSQAFQGVSLAASPTPANVVFDYVRGTATPTTLALDLSVGSYAVRVGINAMGRPTICSPVGTLYAACPGGS